MLNKGRVALIAGLFAVALLGGFGVAQSGVFAQATPVEAPAQVQAAPAEPALTVSNPAMKSTGSYTAGLKDASGCGDKMKDQSTLDVSAQSSR